MQDFYEDFVEKAAESRKTTPERIDAVAQGRVWTGGRRGSAAWWTRWAGWTQRWRSRRSGPAFRQTRTSSWWRIRPPRPVRSDLRAVWRGRSERVVMLGSGVDTRAVGALTAPARLFRRGEPLALMPFAFVLIDVGKDSSLKPGAS